jgi:predicted Holliday junction resolvase-like endonuclease
MPRRVREVRDMEIDEVSLVDRPANQFAKVAIAKRASEEETVSDYFSESGEIVDLEDLEFGDVVYDAEGNGYEWTPADEVEDQEQELEGAGVSKSLSAQVREDLAKALTDVERNDAISKALAEVSKAEERAKVAEEIAKSERELRLTREYIAKAAEYNVPVQPEQLGPVLMRMALTMSDRDCAVIHKALNSAGEMLFQELGYAGGGDNADVLSEVDAAIEAQVAKSQGDVTREELIVKAFQTDNSLYDQYLADRARS